MPLQRGAFATTSAARSAARTYALADTDAGSRHEESLYGEGIGAATRLEQQRAAAEAAVGDYLRSIGAHAEYPVLGLDPHRPRLTGAASVSARADAVVQLD